GILTTAEKKGLLADRHVGVATDWMCRLNTPGTTFGALPEVAAMTDVTGFGLLGHLVELCDSAGVAAEIDLAAVPRLEGIDDYIEAGAVPGGTGRNFASYGDHIGPMSNAARALLCDPQTSGGLLVAVRPGGDGSFLAAARAVQLELAPIGKLVEPTAGRAQITIHAN
ncbi:MAG: selenide, water dikinase SelD, partial [Pseudomonadota bacterium]